MKYFKFDRNLLKEKATSILMQLKKFYNKMPFSEKDKSQHRQMLRQKFPRIYALIINSNGGFVKREIKNKYEMEEVVNEKISLNEILDVDNPVVSIIIPCYGQLNYTLRCLLSIKKHLPKTPIEIIVIDDCSNDDSYETIRKIVGLKTYRNTENLGFIRSCNKAAKLSRGQYLYFLNNDTKVTENWLDSLFETFNNYPSAGLVGSKLIYPDGRLQEAGGIIWSDGTAWNYGRFQDPTLPEYNYVREVDYCSGASIMIPKGIFKEVGGFDELYVPAYCEDSDIALKIRSLGYRVLYQPASEVVHFEGITSGVDESQGVKSYQVKNTKKLYSQWKDYFHTLQENGADLDKVKDRRVSKRALVIDSCTPTPDQDAGSVTSINMMLLLREMGFQVTFIPEDNFLYMPKYTTLLQSAGIEVLYAPFNTSVLQHLKESGGRYDLALVFRPVVMNRHINDIRKFCPNAKVLFHTVDLHYLRMSREAALYSDSKLQEAANEMKKIEFTAIQKSDATIVHSTVELEKLQEENAGKKVHVFPLIMDIKRNDSTLSHRKNIVFVGGYNHAPNVDAVKYFVSEIMPILRKNIQGVKFYIVGSSPPKEIKALASEDIFVQGYVENLTEFLNGMRVSVAPLRYGAGIKGKVGTALAAGLPVVASSVAVEGMSLDNFENILISDDVQEFASYIEKLYTNDLLWEKLSVNGQVFAENEWGGEAAMNIFKSILNSMGVKAERSKYPITLYTDD